MVKIEYAKINVSRLPTKERELLELKELKKWFDTYYTIHVQKYNRLIALGRDDNGLDPNEEIKTLYEDAETKRNRINEIELKYGVDS